uniref:Histo-blood group ABO system transferase n=1 Tax=Xenopus tropicalis TaxID=8364 RepID=F6SUP5_XENTR
GVDSRCQLLLILLSSFHSDPSRPMHSRVKAKRRTQIICHYRRTDVMIATPWQAPIVWDGTYNLDILNELFHLRGARIVTSEETSNRLIRQRSAQRKFFMAGHKVHYYVFTDDVSGIPNITLKEGRNMEVVKISGYKRWQDITMRRMQLIRDYISQKLINEVDYLVCLDADLKFMDHIGVEILGDVFGVIHPGFFGESRTAFTHERRNYSAGYIPEDEGDFYYTGCFFGGTVEEVYKLTNFCHNAMMEDKAKNIEALWHDESYLNKYFLYHKPTKLLSPEYAWNDYYGSPVVVKRKRLVHVPKDYNAVRD